MKAKAAIFFMIALFISALPISASEKNKGPANMILDGGNRGNTSFPHSRHQDAIGDCATCHNLFPKKTGSIVELLKQGKLEKKQVMNHCRDCHREKIRAGEKAGPTSCVKCHDKSLKN